MKKIVLISLLIITITILNSCASLNGVNMTVKEMAPVNLDSKINSIVLVNRSTANPESEKVDKIDEILSLEGKKLDQDGAKYTLLGMQNNLITRGGFEKVIIADDSILTNSGMGIFPIKATWDEIDEICKKYKVDAVVCLAFFDTDTRLKIGQITKTTTNVAGVNIPTIHTSLSTNTQLKAGWRIYDNINRLVVDEFTSQQNLSFSTSGLTLLEAFQAITGRKGAVLNAAEKMGSSYTNRLYPVFLRVKRDYYQRGSDLIKKGHRSALAGDWNGAAELWEQDLYNNKSKVAGRAHHNMAIISEINGDIDAAHRYASKAFTEYNSKPSMNYSRILRKRIDNRNRALNN